MYMIGANGGLAAGYNYALARAEEAGYGWLLLLDQDTTLTHDFFAELIACVSGDSRRRTMWQPSFLN